MSEVWRKISFLQFVPTKRNFTDLLTASRLASILEPLKGDRCMYPLGDDRRLTLHCHGKNQFQLALATEKEHLQVDKDGTLTELTLDGWLAVSCFFVFLEPNFIGIIRNEGSPNAEHIARFVTNRAGARFLRDFGGVAARKLTAVLSPREIMEDLVEITGIEIALHNSDAGSPLEGLSVNPALRQLMMLASPDVLNVAMYGHSDNSSFDRYGRAFLSAWDAGQSFEKTVRKVSVDGVSRSGARTGYNLLRRYCEFRVAVPLKSPKSRALDTASCFSVLRDTFREHEEHIKSCRLYKAEAKKKNGKKPAHEFSPSLFD